MNVIRSNRATHGITGVVVETNNLTKKAKIPAITESANTAITLWKPTWRDRFALLFGSPVRVSLGYNSGAIAVATGN